jgi:hypothetical protein
VWRISWIKSVEIRCGRPELLTDFLALSQLRLQTNATPCRYADEINDKTQAVRRVRKFSPRTLAQTFLFAFMKKPTATFENIASMASEMGVNISPQAIEQRFSPALAEFFKAMFQSMTKHLVKSTESLAPILEQFQIHINSLSRGEQIIHL